MNIELVKRIARAVIATAPNGAVDIDDLIQVGTLGMLEANSRFNAEDFDGVPYEAYATTRIRGAMIDELRRMGWASRDAISTAKAISSTQQRLMQQLFRTPTDSEVSSELDITMHEYRQMQTKCSGSMISLDTLIDTDSTAESFLESYTIDDASDPCAIVERKELEQRVNDGIRSLSRRERDILRLLQDGSSCNAIADTYGLSEARISQIKAKMIRKLNRHVW